MFKTVQDASERWIAEGKAYKGKLNDWLDIIYIDQQQRPDEYAVTNTCYVDVKRYLFWHGHEPMIW